MNKLILVILAMCFAGSANAAILCESLRGGSPYIAASLSVAATSNSCRNTSVTVTTPQVVTTAIAWPSDRGLVFDNGGYVTFTGAGALTGLKEVSAEAFHVTGTDDQVAINNALKAVSAGGIVHAHGAYNISGAIVMNKTNTTLDMTGGSITSSASMDSYISIDNYVNVLKGVVIKKTGGTVSQAIKVMGRNHTLVDVTSFDAKFPVFIRASGMWDSHLVRVRVDNDVSGRTGTIIVSDFSVNNTVTDCSFQYADIGIYFSTAGADGGTTGHKSEGWMISGTSLMILNKAIKGDSMTSLSVVRCMLDLNFTTGIELTNGHSATIIGNWFGVHTSTTGYYAIAVGNHYPRVVITGNTFVGNGPATSSIGAIGCPYSIFSSNTIENMSGGIQTWSNTQVFGNTYGAASTPMTNGLGGIPAGITKVDGGFNVSGTTTLAGATVFTGLGIQAPPSTTASTTPGGYTLPALVKEFITIKFNGRDKKIAVYGL